MDFHAYLQSVNDRRGDGSPVRPPTSHRLSAHENGHTPPTTPSEHGVDPRPDRVLPPPETQTILQKDGHDNTPQTTPSDTVVSSQPHPVMPHVGTPHDILGGSCPILPMQFSILWAARKEKEISPLAFKVYFGAQEAKYVRK